jgi:hypothetical protein
MPRICRQKRHETNSIEIIAYLFSQLFLFNFRLDKNLKHIFSTNGIVNPHPEERKRTDDNTTAFRSLFFWGFHPTRLKSPTKTHHRSTENLLLLCHEICQIDGFGEQFGNFFTEVFQASVWEQGMEKFHNLCRNSFLLCILVGVCLLKDDAADELFGDKHIKEAVFLE